MPMGMMGAAAGQGSDRRGHTPAGYLTNATNTTEIIGDPVKVAPAVLGRTPATTGDAANASDPPRNSRETANASPSPGRVLGRNYTGSSTQ